MTRIAESGERCLERAADEQARESSGLTMRLILDYVEREGGSAAVEDVLERCGMGGRRRELRDEDAWFPFTVKIRLFRAASAVLGDRELPRRVGESAIEANVGAALKLALRALGSPRRVYANVARASGKFSVGHRMELLELEDTEARLVFRDEVARRYEPEDCLYNAGLLSCVPPLFGLPPARVEHPECARDGADACVFHVTWDERAVPPRYVAATGALAAGSGASALLAPALLPFAAAALAGGVGACLHRYVAATGRRTRLLEGRIRQQADAYGHLSASLQDLVSALRHEEVVERIIANGRAGARGKELALLVDAGEGMRCLGSTGLPAETTAVLERWASGRAAAGAEPQVLDDLGQDPELAELSADRRDVGSLCSAPLTLADSSRGVLVALARGNEIFLPHDVEWLRAYAMQAAIALQNASVYETQEELAIRDPLTGLLNHREFHETVAAELQRCRRHGGGFAVVLLDLDDFKLVNDQSGHAEGDRVLRAVAGALTRSCRAPDRAFRTGGDEFALVLPETGASEGAAVAERVRRAAAAADPRIALSSGVAAWPDAGPTKDVLLERADGGLYAAKRSLREPANGAVAAGGRERVHADARTRLACASRLAARLAPLLDPVRIAESAVREVQQSFGYLLVVINRIDGDVLRPVAGAGPLTLEMSDFGGWSQPADSGVNGRVVRTGEPALVPDTSRDPDFVATDARRQPGSELSVPVRVAGEIWGVLNIEELGTGAFDLGDLLFADTVAGQIGAALDRARLYAELEGTFVTTLGILSDALERKDAYTAAHAHEVAELSARVAERLGMDREDVRTIRYAGLVHDIGKIGIRSEVLNKPEPLEAAELEEMKQHTIIGASMLAQIPFFERVHPLVRSAHERWDGGGYPDGLAGEEIPRGARVISACDAWNAMICRRPYRPALSREQALAELRAGAGTQLDPEVVAALLAELTGHPSPPCPVGAER